MYEELQKLQLTPDVDVSLTITSFMSSYTGTITIKPLCCLSTNISMKTGEEFKDWSQESEKRPASDDPSAVCLWLKEREAAEGKR